MLSACNAVCLRTAQAAEAGMIGIAADPSQRPKFFTNGAKTHGLCYANGPDNRPGTPGRTDRVPGVYETAKAARLPEMDAVFAEAMSAAMRKNAPAAVPATTASATTAPTAPSTNTDIVWKVLDGASRELDRGEILHGAKNAGLGGGSLFQAVGLALEELLAGLPDGRRIERAGDGTYRACRRARVALAARRLCETGGSVPQRRLA